VYHQQICCSWLATLRVVRGWASPRIHPHASWLFCNSSFASMQVSHAKYLCYAKGNYSWQQYILIICQKQASNKINETSLEKKHLFFWNQISSGTSLSSRSSVWFIWVDKAGRYVVSHDVVTWSRARCMRIVREPEPSMRSAAAVSLDWLPSKHAKYLRARSFDLRPSSSGVHLVGRLLWLAMRSLAGRHLFPLSTQCYSGRRVQPFTC